MLRISPVVLFVLCTQILYAQTDSIFVYDLPTKSTQSVAPITTSANLSWGTTGTYSGNLPGNTPLSHTVPVANLVPGGTFTELAPAADFFDISHYPMRTTVMLKTFRAGTAGVVTGHLVSEDFVALPSALFTIDGMPDSVLAYPAFDNGLTATQVGVSRVTKIFFRNGPDNFQSMALLKLDQKIGLQLGWIGVGFADSASFFTGKVFHKFSYPAVNSPFDSTKIFNGDTMYYDYGHVSYINGQPSYIFVQNSIGIPGQAGSGLIYGGPQGYATYGGLLFSSAYAHGRHRAADFFMANHLLGNSATTGLEEEVLNHVPARIFPNPCSSEAYLAIDNEEILSLKVVDIFGRVSETAFTAESAGVKIDCSGLEPGLYFVRAVSSNKIYTAKFQVHR